jgi:hypothetical protein
VSLFSEYQSTTLMNQSIIANIKMRLTRRFALPFSGFTFPVSLFSEYQSTTLMNQSIIANIKKRLTRRFALPIFGFALPIFGFALPISGFALKSCRICGLHSGFTLGRTESALPVLGLCTANPPL